ncbi:flagellar assembly protein H [Salinisphaera dokdonensis CL-ES53]|uniref:Flagellar assembly protein FliH n=1 Tax=Salinisphaera dokdonensis CL-ES53 TaxID=1304272 RepID=A0ABV2AZ99_9GAMM
MSDRSAARSDAWRPWQMGALDRRTSRSAAGEPDDAPARRREDGISFALFELAKEEAVNKGREEGYAAGLEQGRAEAEAQVRAEQQAQLAAELETQLAPIREMTTSFRKAVDSLNDKISYELVELALEAGRQLAGRALELKPAHIVDDIEDLLADNPSITGSPTLYVNIEDLALVEQHLSQALDASGWALRPDMGLARGDCRVETEQRAIDATGSDRWTRLLHTVGHGEH